MKPVYIITVTPVPRPAANDPSGIRRLRSLLKACLRSYGLRAVSVVECQDKEQMPIDPEGQSE